MRDHQTIISGEKSHYDNRQLKLVEYDIVNSPPQCQYYHTND